MGNRRKHKGIFKKALSFVLGLSMCLTILNGFPPEVKAADLTSKLEYNLEKFIVKKYDEPDYKDFVKNGKVVDPLPEIFETDTARLAYKFNIRSQVNPGDTFTLKLPDNKVFKSSNQINKPLMNGPEQIGTITSNASDGTIKVVFSKGGDQIIDGFISAGGTFSKESNNFEIPLNNNGDKVTTVVKKMPDGDRDKFSPGTMPKLGKQDYFHKYGVYNYDKNYFSYSLIINGAERAKLYKANWSKKDKINKMKKVIMIDELPEGQTFNSKDGREELIRTVVKFEVPAYENGVITEDDMSNKNIKGAILSFENGISEVFTPNGNKKFFTLIKVRQDQKSWEDFKKEIEEKNERTIGVWDNRKIIVNIGTLPMEDIKYEDFFKGGKAGLDSELDSLVTKGKISGEQRDRMKVAFANQGIISFDLEYHTFNNGDIYEDTYYNKAVLLYNNKILSKDRITPVDWLKGGATLLPPSKTLTVEKKWNGSPFAGDIEVQLLADGKEVPAPDGVKTLNAPDWKATFSNLKDGVKYSVKEKNPPVNYVPSIKRTKDGFIISNTEQITFDVKKEWKTNTNADLTTPPTDPIKVGLYKDGSSIPIETVELNNTNGWHATFKPVDKAVGSTDIIYSVKEEFVPVGFEAVYTQSGATFTITNKQKDPGTTNRRIEVSKIWKDSAGKIISGIAPVQVALVKKGTLTPHIQTAILNDGNKWTHIFDNIPVFEGDATVEYSVIEISNHDGFEAPFVSGNMEDGFEITNKKESTEVKVAKLWKKLNGEKLSKAEMPEIEIELLKENDANVIMTKTLSFFENWVLIFKGLEKTDGTGLIKYIVREKDIPTGYEGGHVDSVVGETIPTFTITNTQKKRGDLTVKKIWKTYDDQVLTSGTSPLDTLPSVVINLHKKGDNEIIATQTLSSPMWSATFTNLPMYEVDGKSEIQYEVKEKTVKEGYDVSYDKNTILSTDTEVTITNKQKKRTPITVTKHWRGADGNVLSADKIALLNQVEVKIYKSSDLSFTNPLGTLNLSAPTWSGTFDNLPEREANGTPIEYVVKETPISGFTVFYDTGSILPNDNDLVITNTQEARTAITVNKEWLKNDGTVFPVGTVFPNITVKVYKKGDKTTPIQTQLLSSPSLSVTFNNLPKYELNSNTEAEYEVEEEVLGGYDTTYEVSGVATSIVTPAQNTVKITNKQKSNADIEVKKIWKNPAGEVIDDTTGFPGVKIYLYKKGDKSKIVGVETLPKVSGADKWKAVFKNLPMYEVDGITKIDYEVEEKNISSTDLTAGNEVEGFTVNYDYTKPVWEVVNVQNKKTDLLVTKVWKTADNQDFADQSTLPEVLVNLFNKKDKTKAVASVKLNQGNHWKNTFINIPKYEADGKTEAEYEVEEQQVAGFEAPVYVTDTVSNEIKITNKQTASPPPIIIVPEPEKPVVPNPEKPIPEKPPVTPNEDPNPTPPEVVEEQEPVEVPPTPPTISIVTNDEEIDINIEEDESPLGKTNIEKDKEKKEKGGKKDKNKNKLPATGGLQQNFVAIAGAFIGLLMLLIFVFGIKRKRIK